jgi:hypothetical protein
MPYQPPLGKSKWKGEMAQVRSILRKQRALIASHLDGRIDEDLLLTAMLTLNAQANDLLEQLEKQYSDDS